MQPAETAYLCGAANLAANQVSMKRLLITDWARRAMRASPAEYLSLKLRARELLHDVHLYDVSALQQPDAETVRQGVLHPTPRIVSRRKRVTGYSLYTERGRCLMKYKIALQKGDEGYSVSVPGLPGCWSQGATEDEALENIRDAIREYLAAREDLLRGTTVREVEVAG